MLFEKRKKKIKVHIVGAGEIGRTLAAQLSQDDIEQIWKILEENPGSEITVDLVERQVHAGEATFRFDLDDYTRWRLMEGLDDIGLTLRHEADITAFEARRPAWLPKTLPARIAEG